MLTKPIAVVGLAVGVIVAAGAGAYLAVRQNAAAPPQLVEADAESVTSGLASTEPGEPVRSAVEATEAAVDTLETAVSDDILTPTPVHETPRREPVAVTVAEAPPTDPAPVQTARADLPAVEGWTRPEATEPFPETAPEPSETAAIITNIGSIDSPAPEPVPEFVELEIAADSVIGLQVDTAVSTRTARVEDTVEARVTRDVLVADQVAVPAGTRILGSVVLVEKGGKLRDAARLGGRFHTRVLDDGLQVPVVTETIYREGRSRGSDSIAKIGGTAVGGAILGAIFGGGRGAAIGGSIGAAGGTAAALNNGEEEPAGLPPGTRLTVRLSRPVAVAVER